MPLDLNEIIEIRHLIRIDRYYFTSIFGKRNVIKNLLSASCGTNDETERSTNEKKHERRTELHTARRNVLTCV